MSFKVGDKVKLSKIGKSNLNNYNAYVTWYTNNYTDVYSANELIKNKDILKWII